MANNPSNDKGSFHEIPANKYLFLKGVAIHKRFFRWWSTVLFMFTLSSTYLFTRIFSYDTRAYGWFLGNLWVTIPAVAVLIGVGLIVRWDHSRERKKNEMMRRVRNELDRRDREGGDNL